MALLREALNWKEDADELDCRVAAMIYHDPLVLTERFACEPKAGYEGLQGEVTWAMRAASMRLTRTVRLLLDAGVHPDDPGVFLDAPLVAFEGWFTDAQRLKLLLDRGAKAEVMRRETAWKRPRTFIARYHVEMISDTMNQTERSISESVDCLEMLLRAGAITVDARSPEVAPGDQRPRAAHLLAGVNTSYVTDRRLQQRIADLVPLLAAAGADLNAAEGPHSPAPVSIACSGKFGPMTQALLHVGVKVTDDHTLPAHLQSPDSATSTAHIRWLLDTHFGDEGLSWLRERLMRVQIEQRLETLGQAAIQAADQAEAAPPARRLRCL